MTLVLISGRSAEDLESWFGKLPISLVAEHGAAVKKAGGKSWQTIEKVDTKLEENPAAGTREIRRPDAQSPGRGQAPLAGLALPRLPALLRPKIRRDHQARPQASAQNLRPAAAARQQDPGDQKPSDQQGHGRPALVATRLRLHSGHRR